MPNSFKWRWSRSPKLDPFVAALLEQSYRLVEGAQAVIEFMNTPSRATVIRVHTIEHTADEARRGLLMQLRRSFITPIDREDLFGLSGSIDDVLDHFLMLTREMYLLKVPSNDHLKVMSLVLKRGTVALFYAVKNMQKQADTAQHHTEQIRLLDHQLELHYATALTELFQNIRTADHMIHSMKLRETYRHVVHAGNSLRFAANLIDEVLVKFH